MLSYTHYAWRFYGRKATTLQPECLATCRLGTLETRTCVIPRTVFSRAFGGEWRCRGFAGGVSELDRGDKPQLRRLSLKWSLL